MEDQQTSAHNQKLSEKRAEKKKKANEDSPLEKREMVIHGAKLKCPYAQAAGKLNVTSNEINLQDRLFATKGDGNNMVNLQFKGTCGHPKWPARKMSPPPCMSVIKLSPWQNLGTSIIQEQTALVKESFINCDPEFNAAVASPIPKVERVLTPDDKDEKIKREIYLTFDDGIQAGTEEVLGLLKEKGIKGTFFLTGVHLWYAFSYNEEKAKKILKDIYENHTIGNHSFSHANDHYSSFYRDGGVKIDNKNTRLSVENDFEKNKNQINYYLEKIYGTKFDNALPLAKNQKKALARFPGTNTWYVNDKIKDIKSTNRGKWEIAQKDTEEESNELYKKGYKIFGWDVEWKMSFNFHNDAINLELESEKDKTMDYSKWEKSHPYFDMYSKENISKDRVNQSEQIVRNEILDYAYDNPWTPTDNVAKTEGKVILLMHERAFRKGKLVNGKVDLENTDELNKLRNMIDYFLKINAKFKTLEDY